MLLFSKPEEVIDGYINGHRKRYINAFGYFAISVTVAGLYSFLAKDRFTQLMTATMSSLPKEQIEAQQVILEIIFQYESLINLLLISILALLSWLVFFNYKKYNLIEHLVIYLYAYSHITAVTSLFLAPITFLTNSFFIIAFLPFIVYFFYIGYFLKRLYSISLKKSLN